MHRREFITVLGSGSVAWPFAATAQLGDRVRRVGVLMGFSDRNPEAKRWVTVFERKLGELGWKEGTDLLIDYRWPGSPPDRLRAHAAELVSLNPEALLASNSPTLAFLGTATRTIPIVFANVSGVLARQSGNITGVLPVEPQITEKWVSVIKELVPDIKRLAFVCAQYNISGEFVRGVEIAADRYGLKVVPIAASRPSVNSAIAKFAAEPHGGMVVMPDFVTAVLRDLIITAATQYRLPAIYGHRFFATDYGLMSYGTDIAESFSQAALYVDRILKGEKPADLPLQLPARYDLVINLRAASTIGLTVPETLLARADEVLQ
jgi:putative ABC transport system substrate-binding protein